MTGMNVSGGGEAGLTVADAEQMRLALIEHLESQPTPASESLLVELRDAPAQLAPDGALRFGGWLVEGGPGRPRLTRARPHGPDLHLDVADLVRLPDGRWRVTGLTSEHEWYDPGQELDQ